MDEAKKYLSDFEMVDYFSFSKDFEISKIEWVLEGLNDGYIYVSSKRELSQEEKNKISSWIKGQCSDGIGESFEQQDFASYYRDWENGDCGCEGVFKDYCTCGEQEFIMCSFDWEHNNYELIQVGD